MWSAQQSNLTSEDPKEYGSCNSLMKTRHCSLLSRLRNVFTSQWPGSAGDQPRVQFSAGSYKDWSGLVTLTSDSNLLLVLSSVISLQIIWSYLDQAQPVFLLCQRHRSFLNNGQLDATAVSISAACDDITWIEPNNGVMAMSWPSLISCLAVWS